MWPAWPEMTRDECKKCLRCLELDAYGSMVSVLRAQGPFTSEKQKLLQELAKVLHISNERHRAEVRRAVNDEKLATIAEQLNGPNSGTDWTIEGRRTIPLLSRLRPRSAFTTLANSLSLATAVANEKKPNRFITLEKPGDFTSSLSDDYVAETESQLQVKAEEDLSADVKIFNVENDVDNDQILQESQSLIEDEEIDNKDIIDKVIEKPKVSRLLGKRKCPSPLPTIVPNKLLVVSSGSLEALNHNIIDKAASENNTQVPQPITHHQNVTLIPFNASDISDSSESAMVSGSATGCALLPSSKHVSTISVCNTAKPKMMVGTMQNKVNTKVTLAVSGDASNIPTNKTQSKNNDAQLQDSTNNVKKVQRFENTTSNPSCIKRVASIVHTSAKPIMAKSTLSNHAQRVMTVHSGTTISSGPGPPLVNKASTTLACKKLPSEQTATFNHQSTAKMGVTINSKKAVNISHHPNAKLTSKTNVIVIQKGNTKGVTLSHAGKEVLGKVIMGGKNLCVASQHNTSSINVLPHHISLNNGDQTTALPTANSPNIESVKTNVKSGNAIVFNLRQDVLEKNKILSQLFDSSSVLSSESKTVIQSTNARLLKGEYDINTIDKESASKIDAVIISAAEEKQHRKNNDVNISMNSQTVSATDSLKSIGSKEILLRPRQLANIQDVAVANTQIEHSSENIETFDTTLESTDINLENFQYLVDDNDSHVLKEPRNSTIMMNKMNDHVDS